MTTIHELEATAKAPHGQARSLPFGAYRDEAVLDLELDRIFLDDWVFVCAVAELHAPGAYYAFRLGGEPLVVLRGRDGRIRALSNVCRHRGTQLLDEGFGQLDRSIVCPYHAWSYDDEGGLQAVPLARDIPVDRQAHCLPNFAVHEWLGLLFVNLAESPTPFDERIAGLEPWLDVLQPGRFDGALSGPVETWQSNWKLVMENAMESYHLFKVHATTLETVSPTREAFYLAGCGRWAVSGGALKGGGGGLGEWLGLAGDRPSGFYLLIALPPSFVAILDHESLGWVSAHPLDATTTRVRSGALVMRNEAAEDAGSRAFTEQFFAEDKAICERVQAAMGARRTQGGQLVDMERIVVDFHHYLAERLFGTAREPVFEDPQGLKKLEALTG